MRTFVIICITVVCTIGTTLWLVNPPTLADGELLAQTTMQVVGYAPDMKRLRGCALLAYPSDTNSYYDGNAGRTVGESVTVGLTFQPTSRAGIYKLTAVRPLSD